MGFSIEKPDIGSGSVGGQKVSISGWRITDAGAILKSSGGTPSTLQRFAASGPIAAIIHTPRFEIPEGSDLVNIEGRRKSYWAKSGAGRL